MKGCEGIPLHRLGLVEVCAPKTTSAENQNTRAVHELRQLSRAGWPQHGTKARRTRTLQKTFSARKKMSVGCILTCPVIEAPAAKHCVLYVVGVGAQACDSVQPKMSPAGGGGVPGASQQRCTRGTLAAAAAHANEERG